MNVLRWSLFGSLGFGLLGCQVIIDPTYGELSRYPSKSESQLLKEERMIYVDSYPEQSGWDLDLELWRIHEEYLRERERERVFRERALDASDSTTDDSMTEENNFLPEEPLNSENENGGSESTDCSLGGCKKFKHR